MTFGFHDMLSFYCRPYLILLYTDIAILVHKGFSDYDAVNMLVAVSRPRLGLRLRWPYATSYNDSPLFEEFRIWSSTLFSPLHILVIASFLRWNILINPLNPELNPICYLLALVGAHHFLHVSRIRVKSLTHRLLMSYIYIYGAPILDVSRSHTTTHHSR